MRHVLACALLLTVLIPASWGDVKEKLTGTWVVKLELDKKKVEKQLETVPPDFRGQAMKMMEDQMSKLSITVTYKADGTSSSLIKMPNPQKPTEMIEQTETGTWKVVKESGDKATLKMTSKKKGSDKEEVEEIEIEMKGDTFHVTKMPNLEQAPIKIPVVFKRK